MIAEIIKPLQKKRDADFWQAQAEYYQRVIRLLSEQCLAARHPAGLAQEIDHLRLLRKKALQKMNAALSAARLQ